MMIIVPKAGTIVCNTGGHETINGVWQQKHIHGIRIKEVNTELTYRPDDLTIPTHMVERKYYRFRLDDGREFMEYENKDWQWFSGCWAEDPQCCKDAYEKYIKPEANKLKIEIKPK